MNKRLLAFPLLCMLHAFAARAQTDCAKPELAEVEELSSYLRDYALRCLDDALQAQLRAYELPAGVSTPGGPEYLRMQAAWMDIATTFAKLRSDDAVGPEMKTMYRQLEVRAATTAQEVPSVLEGISVPDVSPLRKEAWAIQSNLLLLEVPASSGVVLPDLNVDLALDADCPTGREPLCAKTLEQGRELMRQWKLAERMATNVSNGTIETIAQQVVRKDEMWNTYLYDSKPMLPLDFVLTDALTGGWSKSDQFPDGFREPPRTQWFLLHPTAGVEYSPDALDGEQMKPVLFVEVIGANRWNPDERWFKAPVLKHLSGASFVVSYVDRAGVKDAGYGVLLTFNNVYSVGAARHSDETGVFLSLDLANLFREKYRPRYQKFKDDLEDFKGKLP